MISRERSMILSRMLLSRIEAPDRELAARQRPSLVSIELGQIARETS